MKNMLMMMMMMMEKKSQPDKECRMEKLSKQPRKEFQNEKEEEMKMRVRERTK